MKKIIFIAVSLFVVGIVPVSFSADYPAPLPSVKQYDGVPYISGGIEDEKLDALRSIGRQYNYTVLPTMQGKVVNQKVQVHPKGQSMMYFYW